MIEKPKPPGPRLIREDFLPFEPMSKYRIKRVNHDVLGPIYYPQIRVFFFFWGNLYPRNSSFIGFYETYDGALEDIRSRVKNEKTVEYFYPSDL